MISKFIARNLYFSLFSFAFWSLYIIGPVLGFYLNSIGYLKPSVSDAVIQALIFYSVFFISFLMIKTRVFKKRTNKISKNLYIFPLLVTIAALLLYSRSAGFVLGSSVGYESRYEANTGLGIYTLAMQSFYIFVAGLIFYKKDIPTRKLLVLAVIFFIFTFILLGGQRQLGLGVIAGIMIYLLLEKRISMRWFFVLTLVFLPFVLGIAVLRYEYGQLLFSDLLGMVVIYFYDGLTPLDAHVNIVNYLEYKAVPGFEIAINQFLVYVPRGIWTSKPEVVMNAGNYYSSEILGRTSVITYSPTMLGELLLVHGYWYFIVGIPLAFLIKKIDVSIFSRSYLGIVFLIYSFVAIFNLYREGFYVFLSRILVMAVLACIFSYASKITVKKYSSI